MFDFIKLFSKCVEVNIVYMTVKDKSSNIDYFFNSLLYGSVLPSPTFTIWLESNDSEEKFACKINIPCERYNELNVGDVVKIIERTYKYNNEYFKFFDLYSEKLMRKYTL